MRSNGERFRVLVGESLRVDPMPTFARLAESEALPVEAVVHYALVRWASAGAEALMSIEPSVLRDLFAARKREDWKAVAGIVDWLESGWGGERRP
jgi:hypothetical protein